MSHSKCRTLTLSCAASAGCAITAIPSSGVPEGTGPATMCSRIFAAPKNFRSNTRPRCSRSTKATALAARQIGAGRPAGLIIGGSRRGRAGASRRRRAVSPFRQTAIGSSNSGFSMQHQLNAPEGDFVIENFSFGNGTTLPELRQHYSTLGQPQYDAVGNINNAVLLLHNTTGTSREWLAPELSEPLFGAGQPLPRSQFFVVMPDCI